jgi:hypothetical protein
MSTVLLNISDNEGYAPDQIGTSITLTDLLAAVEQAIADHGDDAKVVLSNGQKYGAGFGSISPWADVFTLPNEEDGE